MLAFFSEKVSKSCGTRVDHSHQWNISILTLSTAPRLWDNLENSKQSSQDLSVSIPPEHCPTSLLNFTPVTEHFASDLLQKSPAKSCMLDPVPVHLLKKDLNLIVPPVTNIINVSLSQGVFPSSLKKAIIFPSLKKGNPDHEEYNSYRPISNIAFLSKTLERAASIQTTN